MMRLRIAAGAAALASLPVRAHDGHGIEGPHWHATDAVGFLVVGVVAAALAWWMSRK
jgi:hypothetical protein